MILNWYLILFDYCVRTYQYYKKTVFSVLDWKAKAVPGRSRMRRLILTEQRQLSTWLQFCLNISFLDIENILDKIYLFLVICIFKHIECRPQINQIIWLKRLIINVKFVVAVQFYELYYIYFWWYYRFCAHFVNKNDEKRLFDTIFYFLI